MKEYAVQINKMFQTNYQGLKHFEIPQCFVSCIQTSTNRFCRYTKNHLVRFGFKKKWIWGSLVILRLFLCISVDQHLAGLSKTFHNISAMGCFLELHNYSILQPTMGSIKSTCLVQTKPIKLQEYHDTKLWQHHNISGDFACYACTQFLA